MKIFSPRRVDGPDFIRFSVLFLGLLSGLFIAGLLAGCATSHDDTMARRLARMSDDELVSYHEGLNERLKEMQSETVEADHQGTVQLEDPIAITPYIIGGEGWSLEQKLKKVRKELTRRGVRY